MTNETITQDELARLQELERECKELRQSVKDRVLSGAEVETGQRVKVFAPGLNANDGDVDDDPRMSLTQILYRFDQKNGKRYPEVDGAKLEPPPPTENEEDEYAHSFLGGGG